MEQAWEWLIKLVCISNYDVYRDFTFVPLSNASRTQVTKISSWKKEIERLNLSRTNVFRESSDQVTHTQTKFKYTKTFIAQVEIGQRSKQTSKVMTHRRIPFAENFQTQPHLLLLLKEKGNWPPSNVATKAIVNYMKIEEC